MRRHRDEVVGNPPAGQAVKDLPEEVPADDPQAKYEAAAADNPCIEGGFMRTHKIAQPRAGDTACGRETAGRKFAVATDWRQVDCIQRRRGSRFQLLPPYEGGTEDHAEARSEN